MRPIERGEKPSHIKTGEEISGSKYGKYRGHLAERIGYYCSYCERPLRHNIAVEHIQPKTFHKLLELEWDNLLLACVNCNSTKGHKRIYLANYFWPDIDNTSLAYTYSTGGLIRVSPALNPILSHLAGNMISLVGLDKVPSPDLAVNPEITDLRWLSRKEAWDKAEEAYNDLKENNAPNLRKWIVKNAVATGFYSVWMTVFQNDIQMKRDLIAAFIGTSTSCYDDNGEPIHRRQGRL